MKHVKLALEAKGGEINIHPMFEVMIDSTFVKRATTLQWKYTGDEFGIMNYVEGDREKFLHRLEEVSEVIDYELEPNGGESFFVYIRDETTEGLKSILELASHFSFVILPPVKWSEDGILTCSLFGPEDQIQSTLQIIPEFFDVSILKVTETLPSMVGPSLTHRQREAVEIALEIGYYDVPRTASHEDVASELNCAPSTASEHLRKAEANIIRSTIV